MTSQTMSIKRAGATGIRDDKFLHLDPVTPKNIQLFLVPSPRPTIPKISENLSVTFRVILQRD